jgi:hypothetical protein
MRKCGDDVQEVLHDGHPTACIGDAAFGYVNAFTGHVNIGFFRGAEIADPAYSDMKERVRAELQGPSTLLKSQGTCEA